MGSASHGKPYGPSEDLYRLKNLWCLHLYRYFGEVLVDGQPYPIEPGFVGIVKQDAAMLYRYRGLSQHCYCHFVAPTSGPEIEIPVMQNVGSPFESLHERLRSVAGSSNHTRQRAVVWDILWSLTAGASSDGANVHEEIHPAVARSLAEIERRIADPPSVAELASAAGISYCYLSRLFQASTGTHVVGFIQKRRAEHAEHLIRNSTMSIKAVANAIGMPDLQQFNRLMHRVYGCSPRGLKTRS